MVLDRCYLGEGRRDDGLAADESPGDGSCATLSYLCVLLFQVRKKVFQDGRQKVVRYLDAGEESVQDPLSSEEGVVGRELLSHWTGLPDWPHLDYAGCRV